MTIMKRFIALFFIIILISSGVHAHEYQTGNLVIDHPHLTKPLPGASVSAGYVNISNNGTESERLIGVTAEFAEKSELHNVKIIDGIARMRPVKGGIVIAPGETVELKHGGLHLMFIRVSEDIEVGQLRPVKLLFEKAGIVEVEMIVLDPADLDHDEGTDNHSDHSGHTH